MSRAKSLPEREYYRLIELLDPSLTHYEFFLTKPPLPKADWSDDKALLKAIPERYPYMEGYPGLSFFNYDYQMVTITEAELAFLQVCDNNRDKLTVEDLLQEQRLELDRVRSLQERQLIILSKS